MANMLKLLPACGFVIAAALVCVTSAFKDAPKIHNGQTLYRFVYTPVSTGDYSAGSVETVTNWTYDDGSTSCPSGSAKACAIMASKVDDTDPDHPVLLESEDIVASGTTTARVTKTADASDVSSSNITNRSN